MTIPVATISSLCSSSEMAIVRASRKPEIELISKADLKRLAAWARKHFDKWNKLARGQARKRGRLTGSGDTPKNTKLKAQIFREAVERFEAKLATLEGSAAAPRGTRSKTKKARAVEHRASRAAIRKGMAAAEDLLKSPARKKQK